HFLCQHAVIVVFVISVEIYARHALYGRVIHDRNEIRQYRLVDLLREGLTFAFALLPMTFNAVSKNFVKENAARSAGKNRVAREWIDDGSGAERFQIGNHRFDRLANLVVGWETIGSVGVESLKTVQLH